MSLSVLEGEGSLGDVRLCTGNQCKIECGGNSFKFLNVENINHQTTKRNNDQRDTGTTEPVAFFQRQNAMNFPAAAAHVEGERR